MGHETHCQRCDIAVPEAAVFQVGRNGWHLGRHRLATCLPRACHVLATCLPQNCHRLASGSSCHILSNVGENPPVWAKFGNIHCQMSYQMLEKNPLRINLVRSIPRCLIRRRSKTPLPGTNLVEPLSVRVAALCLLHQPILDSQH